MVDYELNNTLIKINAFFGKIKYYLHYIKLSKYTKHNETGLWTEALIIDLLEILVSEMLV